MSRSQTILEKFSLLTMAGVKLELGIVRAFTRWGTFCARHPLIVIAASILVCIGLSVGIIWLKVGENTSRYQIATSPTVLYLIYQLDYI